jgi:VIT1/CCC1 family predicted Fe2+/Mn2+ transporter
LLASVSGDDVMGLMLAADSIKRINLQIVELLSKGEGNFNIARKYTGIHMVLVDIYLHAHELVLNKIAGEYSPRLDEISSSALLLKKQAESMLASTPAGDASREVLETNVRANERTVRTAALYRDYLRAQQNKLRSSAEKLKNDLSVARNTYQTVKTGGDLISLINTSMRTLESVYSFVLPDLSAVYDREILKEFERITGQIRKGS